MLFDVFGDGAKTSHFCFRTNSIVLKKTDFNKTQKNKV